MLLSLSASLLPVAVLASALIGACVGSFLNLVAWRLPRQESVLRPGSHCPRCGTPLGWFELVPVLSWLLQRGRCRHCQAPVRPRYPAVELLTAGLFVATAIGQPSALQGAPPLLELLAGWMLVSLLLPLLLIDLDHLWLPEPLCRWGVLLGLGITAVAGFSHGNDPGREALLGHLLATSTGLLGFEAVSAAGARLLGKPALGLGDAKLAALLGAWLGLSGLGLALTLAVFSGAGFSLIGLLSGRLKRGQPFPFGPFLAGAGLALWVGGNGLWLDLLQPLLGGWLSG
jgi:leader peptidase (prepilin peptidase)/N-methyltransferase